MKRVNDIYTAGRKMGVMAGITMGAFYFMLDYFFNTFYLQAQGVSGVYALAMSAISGIVVGAVFIIFFYWIFYNLPRSANVAKAMLIMTLLLVLRFILFSTFISGTSNHIQVSVANLKIIEAAIGTAVFLMVYVLCLGYFWGHINAEREFRPVLNTKAMKAVKKTMERGKR